MHTVSMVKIDPVHQIVSFEGRLCVSAIKSNICWLNFQATWFLFSQFIQV